jgi:16S rRNA (guanine527-N7)-methyltransferase
LGSDGFAKAFPVSRETLDRLEAYSALLIKWQKAVNLVGPKTLSDLWRRHFLDSAQLVPMIPPQAKTLMDIGSGAGFPGLVLAILGIERPEPLAVHLVESDRKKATFLQEAARVTGAPVTVHCARIESLSPQPMDVITARALAPLVDLMAWSRPFWGPNTVGLFLKGQDSAQELSELQLTAPQDFENINIRRWPSRSDARGVVLELARRA